MCCMQISLSDSKDIDTLLHHSVVVPAIANDQMETNCLTVNNCNALFYSVNHICSH